MTDFIVKTVMSIIVFLLVDGICLLGRNKIDPEENKVVHEKRRAT